jgi:micrococcal nuclease
MTETTNNPQVMIYTTIQTEAEGVIMQRKLNHAKWILLIIAVGTMIIMLTACTHTTATNSIDSKQKEELIAKQAAEIAALKNEMGKLAAPAKSEVSPSPASSTPAAADKKYIIAKVTKVVDGDTINVLVGDKKETIRLVLVDTPETKHPTKPVEPFGPEASQFMTDTLEGKEVKLEKDVSERDQYGRLLMYVWLGDKMVNELLLEKGLARVAVYQPDIKYVDSFRGTQKKAQQAGIGIWSIENYAQEDGYHPEATKKPAATANADPTVKPSAAPIVTYANCTAVRAAGKAPLHKGDPGYSSKLDRDQDGIACE